MLRIKRLPLLTATTALCLLGMVASTFGAGPRQFLRDHVPSVVTNMTAIGLFPGTNQLHLAIGLPLRNEAALTDLLQQIYDPASTNYHRYLTPEVFTERFGPTAADYQAVMNFARTNGLTITTTHDNRLLLDVSGSVANVNRTFHLTLRMYKHPQEARTFYSPDVAPSVDLDVVLADISGLNNYSLPRPKNIKFNATNRVANATPQVGSGPGNTYLGNDFRAAYVPGTPLNGAGQMVGLLQFDGFYSNDIVAYKNLAGLPDVPVQTILLDGYNGIPTTGANSGGIEVSLDIEMAIAMAPGLAKVVMFEAGPNGTPNDILNAMAAHSEIKQFGCSWGWSGGPSTTTDNIFMTMAAQGQSFFNASGDSDAFTASFHTVNGVDNLSLPNTPSSCPYITQVGGTTLTVNGTGGSYASEKVWNWGGGTGSSGGVSSHYSIPSWQTGISMAGNGGSTTKRNIPDVALTADNVYVAYNNGSGGSVGGTSCAAPLWAGYMALINQQAAANSLAPIGFVNPALYTIGKGTNFSNCFHDVTTGNNTWSNSPSAFYATSGYDLCTGWGTPKGTNLINALAPFPRPVILTQPVSQLVIKGASVSFNVTASSQPAMVYKWVFNGTNLTDGGNISGAAGNVLSMALVTTNNAGNYRVVVANTSGSITSSVAVLTVVLPATLANSLADQNIECGGNVSLEITGAGTPPLNYQWSLDGVVIAGATNSGITLNNIELPSHTVGVTVTNLYGSATSTAALNIQDTTAPVIILNGGNPLFVELGSTFSDPGATATDTCAGAVAVAVSGSVNANLIGTNFLDYTANDGNGNSSTIARAVIVRDTTPPTILWSFTNLTLAADGDCVAAMPDVTGTNFILATDFSDELTFSQSPTNNSALPLGTNTVVIEVQDASGNSAYATNFIVVQDQTPPVILNQPQSQTNSVGSAANFEVVATACTPLVYQWFFNNTVIADQTNSTLALAAVSYDDAGNYSVIVTAVGGSITSAVATLTILNSTPVITHVTIGLTGSFTLDLTGLPGDAYVLEATTNLISPDGWQPLATNTLGTNGVWQFNDPEAASFSQRFYRLRLAP